MTLQRQFQHVIFDLDDTLSSCFENYDSTSRNVAKIIHNLTNTPVPKILEICNGINVTNAEKFGYGRYRYVVSWVETYFEVAMESGVDIKDHFSTLVFNTANDLYTKKVHLHPYVRQTLALLHKSGKSLYICTAGDIQIQNDKIDSLGIRSFFDEIYILPDKTPETFSKIIAGKPPENCVMVGNSKRSDMYPAIINGVFGLRIKRDTWAFEDMELAPESYIEIPDVKSVLKYV